MALLQSADWKGIGLAATYFRIVRVEADFGIEPGVTALVYAYADKDARDAGANPVAAKDMRFGVEQLAAMGLTLDTLTRAGLYDAIRAVELPGATDI